MSSKTVSVIDSNNNETRYTFGNRHFETEGQLQQLDVIDNGVILRSTSMHYRAPGDNPYPDFAGYAEPNIGDSDQLSRLMPLDQRVTIQQGVTFTWQANSFDKFARATNVTRSSTLGASRSETTAYADNFPKWVLGQVKQLSEDSTGKVMAFNGYNATTTANLETVTRFGKLEQTMTYHADGTLATQKDGRNQTTTFSDYRRKLARTIRYQNGSSESAVVNNIGTIDKCSVFVWL